ncbi:MAG: hypothetical protein QM702_04280 [Rubrivivax sp.]
MLRLLNAAAAAIGWLTLICALLAAIGLARFVWAFDIGPAEPDVRDQPEIVQLTDAA